MRIIFKLEKSVHLTLTNVIQAIHVIFGLTWIIIFFSLGCVFLVFFFMKKMHKIIKLNIFEMFCVLFHLVQKLHNMSHLL